MITLFFLLAASDPVQVLKEADRISSNFKDEKFVMTMQVDFGNEQKQARMETMQKGADKRLIRFLSPGDVKGMAILIEGKDSMYVYLPQYQKVRRVAGNQQSQGLLGTDLSNEEMGALTYSDSYTPTLIDEDDNVVHLKLTPKGQSNFDALNVTIDKKTKVITQIDYVQGGKAVRRQTRSDFKPMDGTEMPMKITIENLAGKTQNITLTFDDVKINSNIPDTLFTKQALERAR